MAARGRALCAQASKKRAASVFLGRKLSATCDLGGAICLVLCDDRDEEDQERGTPSSFVVSAFHFLCLSPEQHGSFSPLCSSSFPIFIRASSVAHRF